MTNEDFLTELSHRLNWTTSKTSATLTMAVSIMNEKLSEGVQISLQDFGVFDTQKESEYIFVDSDTQQRFLVPPNIIAVFNPAAAFEEKIKNNS